jgi:OmcA/MtrC family decaheme c-type cytochrome
VCHTGSGSVARSGPGHQADYDQLYLTDAKGGKGLIISSMTVTVSTTNFANDTIAVKFHMALNGANFNCSTDLDSGSGTTTSPGSTIGSYWASYDWATNTFPSDLSLYAPSGATKTITDDGAGNCTLKSVLKAGDTADATTFASIAANADGIITLYGANGVLEKPGHMQKAEYPFGAVLRQGPNMGLATAPYVSPANVTGCENCHTQPFYKHAYIAGAVADLTPGAAAGTTQQFYLCKGCHYDTRTGGDQFWGVLQDAKNADATTTTGQALQALAVALNSGATLTAAQTTLEANYNYKARLMNDVHMSHANEFPYPQSMRNCVTCHAGHLDSTATGIFKTTNFEATTCISCHSVNGIMAKMSAASYNHSSIVSDTTGATLRSTDCTKCHDGSAAPTFQAIHTGGYDPLIYDANGDKYADKIVVTIDSVTFDATTSMLDIKFSSNHATVAGFGATPGSTVNYSADSIVPTVEIGLYGYNTHDLLVSPHDSDANGNRLLEYPVDGTTTNPRFTTVSAAAGSWEVTADLSAWKDLIVKGGAITHAEIAVMPALASTTITTVDHTGKTVAADYGLNAPSETFDLINNAADAAFYPAIVNVLKTPWTAPSGYVGTAGCNTCHDQLATTFHSGDRGGNIKVCKMCHVKESGGSNLEMQSRSIDSWVHAIHSFQTIGINNVKFDDPFQAMLNSLYTETQFPKFGIGRGTEDCEACHVHATSDATATYNVPDQSKALPALMSGSTSNSTLVRSIGTIQSYVTGPAANACGACHRAMAINDDDAATLSSLYQHWTQNGYMLQNQDTLWNATVTQIMSGF